MMKVVSSLLVVTILQYIPGQIITFYNLKLTNVICQLYLNKAGKNSNISIFCRQVRVIAET